MPGPKKLNGISIEAVEENVSLIFRCGTVEEADELVDILAVAVSAGTIRVGDLTFSPTPIRSVIEG